MIDLGSQGCQSSFGTTSGGDALPRQAEGADLRADIRHLAAKSQLLNNRLSRRKSELDDY